MRLRGPALIIALLVLVPGCSKPETPGTPTPNTPSAAKRQPREQPGIMDDIPKSGPGITVTMHRTSAGEPDEDGWCLAESTEGGFSVKLPSLFDDLTVSSKTASGLV